MFSLQALATVQEKERECEEARSMISVLTGQSDRPLTSQSDRPLTSQSNRPLTGQSDRPLTGQSDQPLPTQSDQPLTGQSDQPLAGQSDRPLTGQLLRLTRQNASLRAVIGEMRHHMEALGKQMPREERGLTEEGAAGKTGLTEEGAASKTGLHDEGINTGRLVLLLVTIQAVLLTMSLWSLMPTCLPAYPSPACRLCRNAGGRSVEVEVRVPSRRSAEH